MENRNLILDLIKGIKADKIIHVNKVDKTEDAEFLKVRVSIYKTRNIEDKNVFIGKIRKIPIGSIRTIREIVISAIDYNFVNKGDKVVCIIDEGVGMGYKGMYFVLDIDNVLFHISRHKLSDDIAPSILDTIIDIASEIASEGREGKKYGTAFVIGDKEELSKHVKQLTLNPFLGWSINITSPDVKETIKEFAQLDGVIIISKDGTVLSGCSYLDVDTGDIALPGLGTRHRSAAAITKYTHSLAVVVSSSGIIRVFKEGNVVMKI